MHRERMIDVVRIGKENRSLVSDFIAASAPVQDTFRYFNNRTIAVLDQHLCTLILLSDGAVAGYGHLDKEADTVWLGIALLPAFQGQGLGKTLLQALIAAATDLQLSVIHLSVDKENTPAIRLYEHHGFQRERQTDHISFYKLTIS
ncbi:GNAT family N-acetyltransferase [Chitinophaga nivalis]|uniref:GNAT family N-acetyltransferase n=1 Tax=Chitinophaga nivalis TaxID=2991709 RepID=A0ABT3IRK0_9BACT|nr:GNAT family N-acetyltransferase [Chitinophaga nivalis]MCW3463971.1 GNAT family N-acetyltransferase [Chitinophaga nivalis]MCW3486339.1 GNAT family N-acetyltransferase [Chitinophaga nivalis]